MCLINRHIVLLLYYNIQETPACISAGRGLAVLKWNHFMIPRWPWSQGYGYYDTEFKFT